MARATTTIPATMLMNAAWEKFKLAKIEAGILAEARRGE
jgi:hypothetical protein